MNHQLSRALPWQLLLLVALDLIGAASPREEIVERLDTLVAMVAALSPSDTTTGTVIKKIRIVDISSRV